jgi:uncharacterized membrane protein YfcA
LNTFEYVLFAGLGSLVAGLLGSLTGLGGGVVIVPMLTLVFGVDVRYAIGASLISVIATSSGAAATYVKEGFSNIRIGMFLEMATTLGALFGALIATVVSGAAVGVLFGLVLLQSAYLSTRSMPGGTDRAADPMALRLRMDGSYPGLAGPIAYHVQAIPTGFSLMFVAGALSGLLGIGSGAIKVLAMDRAMHIPYKVSTTTSNFMIGVTAAASAGVYLGRGYIDPIISMPVFLGVLTGSVVGARILMRSRTRGLRLTFAVVIFVLGIEMIYNSLTGRI